MIAFKHEGDTLDLFDNTNIAIEADSYILSRDSIPGTKIYNTKIRNSPLNRRKFGFPDKLNIVSRVSELQNVQLFIHNVLWKVGTLKLRNPDPTGYNVSFHTDAGDIQLRIKNKSLRSLDLGQNVLTYNTTNVWPEAKHVLFPISNPDFYDNKNPDYQGYINYYSNGEFPVNVGSNSYAITPFPFLLYVLETVVKELGYYGITGAWTEDADIKRVCIYNNYAMDLLDNGLNVYQSIINYNNHVPDITIGAFLIDVAIFFGISFNINPQTKYVEIVKLKPIFDNQAYKNLSHKAAKEYSITPNDYNGLKFTMQNDGDKIADKAPWLEYKLENGGEEIKTMASTIFAGEETDHINIARTWTIPQVLQKGSSNEFDLGINSHGLKFMLYNGLKNDNQGNPYPQGHYINENISLRWEGATGLIAKNYQEWINWKQYTNNIERKIRTDIADLLTFNFGEKIMIDNMKYIVNGYKGSVSFQKGLGETTLDLYSIKL